MSVIDPHTAAKLYVMNTLRGGHAKSVNFTLGGVTVRSSMFLDVALAIGKGKIGVIYVPSMAGEAEYYSGNKAVLGWNPADWRAPNTLMLGFTSNTDPRNSALVIHEAVHAGFDMEKRPMNHMTSEAVAYVAQAMYFLRVWGWNYSLKSDPILGPATSIAKALNGQTAPSAADVTSLRDAILADPHYSSKDMMNGQAVFNGV
ncbi:MAG: hypothetical protein JNL98_23395, partial [Bryobacterales bacterium]|nr:hypothetical protein [Bryobacterales bacterium]